MLGIPSQQVVAPIDVCHIVAGGLRPPPDIRRTCYWAGGAAVSARAGTTVIVGQCNWAGRWGALGRIGSLRPGDSVLTSGAHGQVTEWRVGAVVYRPKSRGILPAAFTGRSGPRRRYLITGGGRYDAQQQAYLDNIYVLATPDDR
jgi:hypothetical protein